MTFLFHLFYNGRDVELFKNILDEKNNIDRNFDILNYIVNQYLINMKLDKEIKFVRTNSNISFNEYISNNY